MGPAIQTYKRSEKQTCLPNVCRFYVKKESLPYNPVVRAAHTKVANCINMCGAHFGVFTWPWCAHTARCVPALRRPGGIHRFRTSNRVSSCPGKALGRQWLALHGAHRNRIHLEGERRIRMREQEKRIRVTISCTRLYY